jgi:hypothetical protein
MAREESDREDLLAEATALVERAELLTLNDGIAVVAGFRRDGAASFFFGADPVYQFNSQGQLRRAFRHGKLIKAEQGRLVSLTRVRTETESQLVRHELTRSETRTLLADLDDRLNELSQRVRERRFQLVGQVPAEVDVVGRIERWLDSRGEATIAESPRVG